MRFWDRFRTQRATAGVLCVLLLVMLLSLVACLGIYGYARDALTRATISAGEQTLTQLLDSGNHAYEDAQQLLLQLSLDKEVRQYRYDPREDAMGERYWSYPLMTSLRERLLFHPSLDNIYLYYPRTNVVLGNLTMLQDGMWLNGILFGGQYENEAAMNAFLAQNNTRAAPVYVDSADGGHLLVLWRRGLYNTYTSSDVYIFLPLYIDRLVTASEPFLQSPNASSAFCIVDERGALVASRGQEEAVSQIDWESLALEPDRGIAQVNGSVLLYGTSSIQGWRFVLVYSPEVFWWQTRMMGIISAVLIAFYVLVALSIGIWYYRWNKRQVGQILSTLEEKAGFSARHPAGEYQGIQGALLELVHRHDDLRAHAQTQTIRLRKAYLQSLITGRVRQQGFGREHYNDALGISLEDTYFAVIVVDCPMEGNVLYVSSATPEENRELLLFALENIAGEMISRLGRVYALDYNETAVLLINVEQPSLEPVQTATEALASAYRRLLCVPVSVAISGMQEGVRSIQYAYQEAMEAFEQAASTGASFFAYAQLPKTDDGQAGGFSLLAEQQLLGSIRTAQADKAAELILQTLRHGGPPSARRQRFLYTDIVCALIKAAEELRGQGQDPHLFGELYDLLSHQDHPQEALVTYTRRLCAIAEQVMQHNRPLSEVITAYIEEHYCNPSLNVTELGKAFHRAPSYLSRLYKEATGIALTDQIAAVRMIHAKALLGQDALTIQEVATRCGYYDYSSFARTFKKHLGVSPRQYREMRLSES